MDAVTDIDRANTAAQRIRGLARRAHAAGNTAGAEAYWAAAAEVANEFGVNEA